MPSKSEVLEKPLECPVPHHKRHKWWAWMKRLGFWGFLFFLAKGLLWLIVPYLVAKGLLK